MSLTSGQGRATIGWIAQRITTLVLALQLALSATAVAAQEGSYQKVGDLAAYLGVLPAQIVQGHPAGHTENKMHGGAPNGPHEVHLVVALFDAPTGARIEDATVKATITGLGHLDGTPLQLEPMQIAGTITYGGFVDLPGTGSYAIALEIRRPDQKTPSRIDFTYDHVLP